MKHSLSVILKVLLGVILTPIVLVVLLAIALYIPAVQNWAVDYGSKVASEKTGDQSVSYHSGSVVSPASSAAKRSYSAAAEMYIKDKRLLERGCWT